MKYIIISKLDKYHLLFLSYFIIKIIDTIMNKIVSTDGDIIKTFHKNYILSMSDFLSIIPFIIIKVRTKNISKNKIIRENGQGNKQKACKSLIIIY